jgi:cyclopropane fatty-acyl-phospholipid synthase-like methyltransferase
MTDRSNGYEAIATWWIATRSPTIGLQVVLDWARDLAAGAAILDLGCGDGVPMAVAVAEAGFDVHGVDASPTMIAGFREKLPGRNAECCAVEDSMFFHRTFDGVMSRGLIFLLKPEAQRALIAKVARTLNRAGRFLFTAPCQIGEWHDSGTGQLSVSLGREEYIRAIETNGLTVVGSAVDEGQNHYYLTQKRI